MRSILSRSVLTPRVRVLALAAAETLLTLNPLHRLTILKKLSRNMKTKTLRKIPLFLDILQMLNIPIVHLCLFITYNLIYLRFIIYELREMSSGLC